MRVLTLTGIRSFNVVLREYAKLSDVYSFVLYNENDGSTISRPITKTVTEIQDNLDQLNIEVTRDFNEGDEYSFYITGENETTVLHRNKIFFTDKVPQDYSING